MHTRFSAKPWFFVTSSLVTVAQSLPSSLPYLLSHWLLCILDVLLCVKQTSCPPPSPTFFNVFCLLASGVTGWQALPLACCLPRPSMESGGGGGIEVTFPLKTTLSWPCDAHDMSLLWASWHQRMRSHTRTHLCSARFAAHRLTYCVHYFLGYIGYWSHLILFILKLA